MSRVTAPDETPDEQPPDLPPECPIGQFEPASPRVSRMAQYIRRAHSPALWALERMRAEVEQPDLERQMLVDILAAYDLATRWPAAADPVLRSLGPGLSGPGGPEFSAGGDE